MKQQFKKGDIVTLKVSPYNPKMQVADINDGKFSCFWIEKIKGKQRHRTEVYDESLLMHYVSPIGVTRLIHKYQ